MGYRAMRGEYLDGPVMEVPGKQADGGRVSGGSGGFLSSRLGGFAVRRLAGDQELAQCVEIAAQHAQTDVARKAHLAPIAATLQAVARLQGPDGRLDPRVPLPRLAELDRRLFLLPGRWKID